MKRILTVTSLVALSVAHATGLGSKETYQPIIDAKPFGDMAASTETDTATLIEQQKQKEEIAQKFRMCGITDMPDGTRKIAFLDETSGAMASYLLGEGETQNGFTLITADYDREYATLSKDGLTFTLGLGKGLIDAPPEEVVPLEVKTEKVAESRPAPRATASRAPKAVKEGSFRARLLKRRAAQVAAENQEKEALQNRVAEMEAVRNNAERRVQIERIKQGLAPTQPIQLTPEEDAELEAAGVFKTEEERLHLPAQMEQEAVELQVEGVAQ